MSIGKTACQIFPDYQILHASTIHLPLIIFSRWVGEPLKAIIIPTNVFLTNKKGYPVLTRENQIVIQKFFKLGVQFIVKGL